MSIYVVINFYVFNFYANTDECFIMANHACLESVHLLRGQVQGGRNKSYFMMNTRFKTQYEYVSNTDI